MFPLTFILSPGGGEGRMCVLTGQVKGGVEVLAMKCIRRATRDDAAEIAALRLSEYSRAKEFTLVEPTLLLWNETDDRDVVLAAWDESGKAIATMRGGIARGKQEAEGKLQMRLPDEYVFPALILDRGATKKGYRGNGLNSALRYLFFLSILDLPVPSVLGAVYDKAPRVKTMKSLGYTSSMPSQNVQAHVRGNVPLIITYLDHGRIRDACDTLKKMVETVLREYPSCGDAIKFEI